jgi:hypothetical protein
VKAKARAYAAARRRRLWTFAALAGLMSLVTGAGAAVVVRTAVTYRPVARATRAAGPAAVGTVVRSLPPQPQCAAVRVGDVAYRQCGATWYRPQFSGSSVTYVVVAPPR